MILIDIARFELRRLLLSPLAWVVLAFVQIVHALLFYLFLSRYLQQPDAYSGRGLTEIVIAGYFQSSGLIILLVTPFLTMRLFSEELRSGTIRLLLSAPIPVRSLVLGKFLGLLVFMMIMLVMVSLVPASLAIGAILDYGQFATAVLGLALLLAGLVAAGLFLSTLFRQPVVAAVCTLAVLLLLWTSHLASGDTTGVTGAVANYLSLMLHYHTFTEGILSLVDLFYFLLITTIFLALGIWRIDTLRIHS